MDGKKAVVLFWSPEPRWRGTSLRGAICRASPSQVSADGYIIRNYLQEKTDESISSAIIREVHKKQPDRLTDVVPRKFLALQTTFCSPRERIAAVGPVPRGGRTQGFLGVSIVNLTEKLHFVLAR